MFEILPLNCGKVFHKCRYNGYAVAKSTQTRKIFERISQKSYIDFYLCDECKYIYVGQNYSILFDNLELLNTDNKGVYLNGYNNERIYLSPKNLKIVCNKKEKCAVAAWVQIYSEQK